MLVVDPKDGLEIWVEPGEKGDGEEAEEGVVGLGGWDWMAVVAEECTFVWLGPNMPLRSGFLRRTTLQVFRRRCLRAKQKTQSLVREIVSDASGKVFIGWAFAQ